MKKDDVIKSKKGDLIVLVKQPNTQEKSIIFCNEIEYIHSRDRILTEKGSTGEFDHHLMFYKDDILVYKVYLKNKPKDNEYKSANDAMKAVGMRVIIPIVEIVKRK